MSSSVIKMDSTIESLLNCSICLEPFERPKLLRCGHTFCLGCLEQTVPDGCAVITCPLCNAKTIRPAHGLQGLTDDFRVGQIKEGLQMAARQAVQKQKCDVCRGENSSVKCLQCHKYMCSTCLNKHNRRQDIASHTLLKVEDLLECSTHGDDCSLVCKTCKKLVCITCSMDQCSDHNCLDIGQVARECLNSLDIRGLKGSGALADVESTRKKQLASFKQLNEQIQSFSDKLILQVKSDAKHLMEQIKTQEEQVLEQQELARQKAEEEISKLEMMGDIGLDTLLNGIPGELLKLLPTLQDGVSPIQNQAVVDLKFVPFVDITSGNFCIGNVIMDGKTEGKNVRKNPFRFKKVVHDKRKGNNALIAHHGDIIVRNDFFGENENHVKFYRESDGEYKELAHLAATFSSIFTGNWKIFEPNVRIMISALRQYSKENRMHFMTGTPLCFKKPYRDSSSHRDKEAKGVKGPHAKGPHAKGPHAKGPHAKGPHTKEKKQK